MEIFQKSLNLFEKLSHADKLKTKHTNKAKLCCQQFSYIKYLTYFLTLFDVFIETVLK